MKDFAALQEAFQRAILEGDEAILDDILDSPKETRDVLFRVYRDGYALRLIEVMAGEHTALQTELGEEAFGAMARAYLAAHPSRHATLRFFGRQLPDFLRATEPYAAEPVLAELAALELAVSDTFDASDAADLAVADLTRIAPEAWTGLVFRPQAHVRRIDAKTNALAIWSAVSEEEPPPAAALLKNIEHLIVWREDSVPQVRAMAVEEAMLWDEASAGIPFGVLCEMAATYAEPEAAAGRVAGYLQGWISSGMLAGVTLPARRARRDKSDGRKRKS